MAVNLKASDAAKSTDQKKLDDLPTVTSTGQIMWSTRDLLFPSGRAPRSATPRQSKK